MARTAVVVAVTGAAAVVVVAVVVAVATAVVVVVVIMTFGIATAMPMGRGCAVHPRARFNRRQQHHRHQRRRLSRVWVGSQCPICRRSDRQSLTPSRCLRRRRPSTTACDAPKVPYGYG